MNHTHLLQIVNITIKRWPTSMKRFNHSCILFKRLTDDLQIFVNIARVFQSSLTSYLCANVKNCVRRSRILLC